MRRYKMGRRLLLLTHSVPNFVPSKVGMMATMMSIFFHPFIHTILFGKVIMDGKMEE